MFENDVDNLITAAREEQLRVDCGNLIIKLHGLIVDIHKHKKGFVDLDRPTPPKGEIRTEGQRPRNEDNS